MDGDFEYTLLVKKEIFLYRLPPRQSNRGYRAAEWNLETPAWVGRMRMIGKGKKVFIKLEDTSTGQLYAQCPIDDYPGIAVERALDSSRYFVIRLMDDQNRTMFTGIGFSERSDAFDFGVSLQDYFSRLKNETTVKEQPIPNVDLSLKDGQRIRLNINTKRSGDEEPVKTSRPLPSIKLGLPASKSGGLLLPPPAASRRRDEKPSSQTPSASQSTPFSSQNEFNNSDILAEIFQSPPSQPIKNEPSSLDWGIFQ